MKRCYLCKQDKALDEFAHNKRSKDGRASRCLLCNRLYCKSWKFKNISKTHEDAQQYYQDNADEIKAKSKKHYWDNREAILALIAITRDKRNAKKRRWYRRHKKHARAYGKAYRAAKPEEHAARFKRWRLNNPQQALANGHQYRARSRGANGTATSKQIQSRVDFYGGLCWICHKPSTAIDHVKPLIDGGTHWPSNLRPICRRCNSRKNGLWPFPTTASEARKFLDS